MNQNWNWLNPRKTIYILKIVSQYFCYLVFWILRSLMFFTLSIFLSNKHLPMKTFSNIFFLLGPVIFVNFCIPFMFYYCQQVWFIVRVSSLLLPLNDAVGDTVDTAFGDTVDDQSSFQFSSEVEFMSPLYFLFTLAAVTEAESPCFAQLLQC